MANATIDALNAGSLRFKIIYFFFLKNFTFYKWCVTKVAHCIFFSLKVAQMEHILSFKSSPKGSIFFPLKVVPIRKDNNLKGH